MSLFSTEPLADFKAALERPKKLTFKKTKRGTKKASVRDTPNTPITPYTPHEDTPTSLGYTPTAVGYTPTPVLDKYEVAKPKAKSRSIEVCVCVCVCVCACVCVCVYVGGLLGV